MGAASAEAMARPDCGQCGEGVPVAVVRGVAICEACIGPTPPPEALTDAFALTMPDPQPIAP